jgi:hypothetical protein
MVDNLLSSLLAVLERVLHLEIMMVDILLSSLLVVLALIGGIPIWVGVRWTRASE